MQIKLAEQDDLIQILELQKQCYLEEAKIYNDYKIPPLIQTVESIITDFKQQTFLKIEVDNKIIGSVRAYIEKDTCKIGRLIVHKKFQNQGLGKHLMNTIENNFKQTKRFELFTGHKSTKNLSFYNKLNYNVFKREIITPSLQLVFLEKLK